MYGYGSLWQAENSTEVLVNYKITEYMIFLKIFLKLKCTNMSVSVVASPNLLQIVMHSWNE